MENQAFTEAPVGCPPAQVGQVAYVEDDSPWHDWTTNACWVAVLMQLKDTINIILLLKDLMLLFGIFLGFGVPGLVLYALRWRQLRRRVGRISILVIAVLSLVHEVFWANFFQQDITSAEPVANAALLATLYWVGAGLNMLQVMMLGLGYIVDHASERPTQINEETPPAEA